MATQLSDIYVEMLNGLIKYGSKFTADSELVKDCIHDVFLNLFENKNISTIHNIKFYILRSFRNRLSDELSKKQMESLNETTENLQTEQSIEEIMITKEEEKGIETCLEQSFNCLTQRQKELIRLYYIEQRSYDEICRSLKISYQTAQNAMHTALTRLRKELNRLPSDIQLHT
jgi:RNA polymerase sigma factor (sigma-70 family)